MAGAWVVARDAETGLEQRARTGPHGEFLLPRLPVGDYSVALDEGESSSADGEGEPVHVGLGEVTEVRLSEGAGLPLAPSSAGGNNVSARELEALPVDSGQWRATALSVDGANGAAEGDASAGEASFRGVDLTQNSTRLDGASSDEDFSGSGVGAGVEEDIDAGSDEARDAAAGVGSGTRSVADGGQRAGSSYAFSGAAVREFRISGEGSAAEYGSALYGRGVGGVVTTASRSGSGTLHGMAFYTARSSVLAATDPFALAQTYNNGATTSALVRPQDMRQQFGGSIGGPLWESDEEQSNHGSARIDTDQTHGIKAKSPRTRGGVGSRVFYFYAFDGERRNFPAVSSPGYAGFYSLTATQTALLANRGVTPRQTNTALNYLASLTGTVARHEEQTVNFARLDWHSERSRAAMEYNRVRWSGPGAARSGAVVDRGVASVGSSLAMWMWVSRVGWSFCGPH